MLTTLPFPFPDFVTSRANVCRVKTALTEVAEFMTTVHVAVPVHPPPLQPVKTEPGLDAAESVTTVPGL